MSLFLHNAHSALQLASGMRTALSTAQVMEVSDNYFFGFLNSFFSSLIR